jgi:hypothetical protein
MAAGVQGGCPVRELELDSAMNLTVSYSHGDLGRQDVPAAQPGTAFVASADYDHYGAAADSVAECTSSAG